ncbi:hypothetical protein BAUCODRAFT_147600 [Baudoinia panamericana UAMH 10762]|uniref:Uncharacterized protein n=1 Tax=Baudoinia panamericana (strain UAMH 10762) TaxID=717646 RepID=M2N0T6_BAUPA|nr:uncharacterized protein BAUCODRAFT_147600 [Baudoinia panamericana UAMH 10762]EMC97533.1 hypothetical protein BAUCODRAFT_147600 [Baudoinia panamericana UAMH 10762]
MAAMGGRTPMQPGMMASTLNAGPHSKIGYTYAPNFVLVTDPASLPSVMAQRGGQSAGSASAGPGHEGPKPGSAGGLPAGMMGGGPAGLLGTPPGPMSGMIPGCPFGMGGGMPVHIDPRLAMMMAQNSLQDIVAMRQARRTADAMMGAGPGSMMGPGPMNPMTAAMMGGPMGGMGPSNPMRAAILANAMNAGMMAGLTGGAMMPGLVGG